MGTVPWVLAQPPTRGAIPQSREETYPSPPAFPVFLCDLKKYCGKDMSRDISPRHQCLVCNTVLLSLQTVWTAELQNFLIQQDWNLTPTGQ